MQGNITLIHQEISHWIITAFAKLGIHLSEDMMLYQTVSLTLILILSWLSLRITSYVLSNKMSKLVQSTKNQWDNELQGHGFFERCAHVAPALAIYLLAPLLIPESSVLLPLLTKAAIIYLLLSAVLAGFSVLNTVEAVYNSSDYAKRAPVTGLIQVAKLLLTIIAVLLIISNLIDKSPMLLLSGLGALTAIAMLVFRDTILGFVAGIQIAANRMVNNGDWIEMPQFGADGSVMAIGLTTVKVKNWDNTISTIPTYALIDKSVKNWRGMEESSGRRIKRAIYIDIHSVRFCDQDMLDTFSDVRYIKQYIEDKKQQLSDFNHSNQMPEGDLVNARQLTNIGTFRAYMESYLRQLPHINQDMTLMVRQLSPTELGLPLEVYCFSANKDWVKYEAIQADIFDHFVAMLPVFKLKAYQRISDNNTNLTTDR